MFGDSPSPGSTRKVLQACCWHRKSAAVTASQAIGRHGLKTGCSSKGTAQVSGPHCCHSSSMEGSWKVLGRNEKSLVNWDSVHLLVNQPDPGSWLTCSHPAIVMPQSATTPLQRLLVADDTHALQRRVADATEIFSTAAACHLREVMPAPNPTGSVDTAQQQSCHGAHCNLNRWRPQRAVQQGLACS